MSLKFEAEELATSVDRSVDFHSETTAADS